MPENKADRPAVGHVAELHIDSLAVGGRGVGRVQGLAVFVDLGLPGQRVRARFTAVHKRHAEAELLEVLQPCPAQVAPVCPHFGPCGGCDWQHLEYPAQLEWKRQLVQDALRRLGRIDAPVDQTLASPLTSGFRNKMEFAFAGGAGPDLSLGLRRRGRPAEVLDVSGCVLMAAPAMDILAAIRGACRASGLASAAPEQPRGVWRFATLRANRAGQFQVILLTSPGGQVAEVVDGLATDLLARFPAVVSVVHALRRRPDRLAEPEDILATHGSLVEGRLVEELGGVRFGLSPRSFFQTNTRAAELLVAEIARLAGFGSGESLLDACCGVGTLGLALAGHVGSVLGVEIQAEAVADARQSATDAGIANARFVQGELGSLLARRQLPRPDVLLLDPPRAGLPAGVPAALAALGPQRMVYVSCDPATLARDLAVLVQAGYGVAGVRPVDMFPHSHHVECVALLHRRP